MQFALFFNSLLLDGFLFDFYFYHPTPLKQHWVWKIEMQEKLWPGSG